MKKRNLMTICLVVVMVLTVSDTALADWIDTDPAKWVQLPDLSTNGMDVYASSPIVLADDFECTTTELITDIHIWGSWYDDLLPYNSAGEPDPTLVGFRLSIHDDIPADAANPYSKPGNLLWEKIFAPGDFKVNLYADDIQEGWYNPDDGSYTPNGDTQAWQYNFYIDSADAFQQEGTSDDPVVYWLDLEAFPSDEYGAIAPLFGWKTSTDHWNDDAVWMSPTTGWQWRDMIYPDGHEYAGHSIDLAFAITPEPATIALLGFGGLSLLRRRK